MKRFIDAKRTYAKKDALDETLMCIDYAQVVKVDYHEISKNFKTMGLAGFSHR